MRYVMLINGVGAEWSPSTTPERDDAMAGWPGPSGTTSVEVRPSIEMCGATGLPRIHPKATCGFHGLPTLTRTTRGDAGRVATRDEWRPKRHGSDAGALTPEMPGRANGVMIHR